MSKMNLNVKGRDVMRTIKNIIKKGNATKIVVKNSKGKIILNVPATVLAGGVVLAPFLAGVSAVLGLMNSCTIEVEKAVD